MTRVVRPASAAIRASAALTVVLPTPPFPATMSSRAWPQNAPGSTHSPSGGRLIRRVLTVVWLLGAALTVGQHAASAAPAVRSHVDVIQLSGLIDPVEADFLSHAVTGANHGGAIALVVVLDSGGG